MSNRAKIVDVAKAAGVSPATVSRVLNANQRVAPELADRVQKALVDLGYRRNQLARGLRKQSNALVAVVVPDISNPFFTSVVRGMEDAVQSAGHLLLLCNSDDSVEKESEYFSVLADQQIAGLVVAPADEFNSDLSAIESAGIPTVLIDRRVSHSSVDSVTVDNRGGARMLTEYLLAQSRPVGYIGGPIRTSTGSQRAAGYRDALLAAGEQVLEQLMVAGDFSEQGGYVAAQSLLAVDPRPSSLVVANNAMTLGVIRALDEAQLPPQSIAIASFDELPWSAGRGRRVAVLEHTSEQMGLVAAALLMKRIGGYSGPPEDVELTPGSMRAL